MFQPESLIFRHKKWAQGRILFILIRLERAAVFFDTRPLWSSPKIRDKIQEDQTLVGTETLDTTSDLTGVGPL